MARRTVSSGFVGEEPGKLAAADGVDAGFEGGNAVQALLRVGERLHETPNLGLRLAENRGLILLFLDFGGKLTEDALDVLLVSGHVVGGQQDGAAGQPGFEGVMGDFAFPSGEVDRWRVGRSPGWQLVKGFGCPKAENIEFLACD